MVAGNQREEGKDSIFPSMHTHQSGCPSLALPHNDPATPLYITKPSADGPLGGTTESHPKQTCNLEHYPPIHLVLGISFVGNAALISSSSNIILNSYEIISKH